MTHSRSIKLAASLLLTVWTLVISATSIRGKRVSSEQRETLDKKTGWISSFFWSAYNSAPGGAEFVLPSKCIEDPEGQGCHHRRGPEFDTPVSVPTTVSSYVTDFPLGAMIATAAPSKDMCYGNMAEKNRKFCNSEMPSVSVEPSEQPTAFPEGQGGGWRPHVPSSSAPFKEIPEPSLIPTPSPPPSAVPSTIIPSDNPTPTAGHIFSFPGVDPPPSAFPLGQCQGDCDTHDDCGEGLFCYQRNENEPVPGCIGGESDSSRTDYCNSIAPVVAPVEPPTSDNFCLKMHWQVGYYWQGEDFEREWCIGCNGQCREGETLFLQECAWDAARFDFLDLETDEIQIQAVGTSLCLERFHNDTTLEFCNSTNVQQRWTATDGTFRGDRFEIGQNYNDEDYCLTTHHHPKYGEEVELYKCSVARRDNTSLWNRC